MSEATTPPTMLVTLLRWPSLNAHPTNYVNFYNVLSFSTPFQQLGMAVNFAVVRIEPWTFLITSQSLSHIPTYAASIQSPVKNEFGNSKTRVAAIAP